MAERTLGISELIQRLKHDGIVAGENEKGKLVEAAKTECQKLLDQATKKANEIILAAEMEIAAKKSQMDSELKMAARDFLLEFKNKLKQRVIKPTLKNKIEGVLTDADFIKDCLKEIMVECTKNGSSHLEALVSTKTIEKLVRFFKDELNTAMINGALPCFKGDNQLLGLKLKMDGQNFVWDFSADAISHELSRLVDSELATYLMGEEQTEENQPPEATIN